LFLLGLAEVAEPQTQMALQGLTATFLFLPSARRETLSHSPIQAVLVTPAPQVGVVVAAEQDRRPQRAAGN
jgi:hypothetical protein